TACGCGRNSRKGLRYIMIAAHNLSKQFGEHVLFEDVSFSIGDGERVGLVGRNGHGKTTLFKILTGQEPHNSGEIIAPQNYRIGYLSQHINFTKNTVLEEACLGLPEDQIHDEWRVEKILMGLGFLEDDFFRDPLEFSGGYQIRINLAKVLVSDPDLLLLDEPTNFLDILSIRWLTGFLKGWQRELVIICHDRTFMDAITTHTMAIHRGSVRKIKGSTGLYYRKIAEEEEIYEKSRLNEEKKRQETEEFINRFRAKASKSKQVQSRVKALEKMGQMEKLGDVATLAFSFKAAPFSAKRLIEVKSLSFGYGGDESELFKDLSFTVNRGDKICIVGKNGKGKTTLLRLLAGQLEPLEGEIREHDKVQKAYFEQSHTADLNAELTIEEEIMSNHPDGDRGAARKICGAMMFSGDMALKKISVLSGGEKCRVLLGNLLVKPTNLLLLDEPSNHLDMESTDALMAATATFDGAVVMITHNEELLHRLATKLIVFHDEKVFFFDGSYVDFLSQIGWGDDESRRVKGDTNKVEAVKPKLNKKELRKARADLNARRSAALKPCKEKMEALEKLVPVLKAELESENEAMLDAVESGDSTKIASLSQSTGKTSKRLDEATAELEIVTLEFESLSASFDEEKALLS
ncbi:MAG: ABC-F family ATP-binding cassette domain-containing protein, partial [bacterium]|nr:ABC-F family ATP-binding cassette domain-containing protein [bacterium]